MKFISPNLKPGKSVPARNIKPDRGFVFRVTVIVYGDFLIFPDLFYTDVFQKAVVEVFLVFCVWGIRVVVKRPIAQSNRCSS